MGKKYPPSSKVAAYFAGFRNSSHSQKIGVIFNRAISIYQFVHSQITLKFNFLVMLQKFLLFELFKSIK